jgi:Concanavalin A-like lectin/glucanases superfamily
MSRTSPPPIINGVPGGGAVEGTPVTLTASAIDVSPVDTAAGFNYLWQATDANGNSFTGTQGLSFNGTNQYVDLGNPSDLNFSGPITLEAWIKPGSTGGLQDIITHGYQVSPNDAEDFLRINNGYYEVGSWNGNGAYASAPIPAGDVGQWVFLAGVYDGKQWDLYRNGVLVATSGPTTQGALPVSSTDWAIGGRGTGTERFFNGQIDDASIWDVGLTAAQVQAGLGALPTGSQSGLMAYYQFNESGGATVLDATTHGNNGTLGGGNAAAEPTRVAGIVLGSSLTFTPGDPTTDTVTLEAFDAFGGGATKSATFPSIEAPVTVGIGVSQGTVAQGGTYTDSFTVTDAPTDTLRSAIVNFGDGSSQPLQVSAMNVDSPGHYEFSFSHTYQIAGYLMGTVTVTDTDGVVGVAPFFVSVSGFTVNDGSPQESMVRSLTYTFANPTRIEPGAFELLRDGKPSPVHLNIAAQPDGMTYIITFSGPGVIGASVPDGKYTLITLHKKVDVLSGPSMSENDVNTFIRIFGDVDGDGRVGDVDKARLKQAEADPSSPYVADFEYDGNGVIDKTDIAQFDKRYHGRMDPPSKPPAKFLGRKVAHHVAAHHARAKAHPSGANGVKLPVRLLNRLIDRKPLHHGRQS